MNFLVIISNQDQASLNFKEVLFTEYKLNEVKDKVFELILENSINKIYVKIIDTMHIFSKEEEIIEPNLDINQIIFLSKHSTLGEIKPKSLTVHSIGNWGKADLGGLDHTVIETDPILIRCLLLELKKNKPLSLKPYEIKQEATHHGPYLSVPTIFYEIGSDKDAWNDKKPSKFMLTCLFNVLSTYNREKVKEEKKWIEAVGLGGSHYCTKFNKKTFDENYIYSFGHVIASYGLEDIKLKPELLEEAKRKSNSSIVIKEEEL
jgi:D-aminoacyl-tRNA deacylase